MPSIAEIQSQIESLQAQKNEIEEKLQNASQRLLGAVYATHRVTGAMVNGLLEIADNPFAYPSNYNRLIDRELVCHVHSKDGSIRIGNQTGNSWQALTPLGQEVVAVFKPKGWAYKVPTVDQPDASAVRRSAPRG